jgi:hypothetical protein
MQGVTQVIHNDISLFKSTRDSATCWDRENLVNRARFRSFSFYNPHSIVLLFCSGRSRRIVDFEVQMTTLAWRRCKTQGFPISPHKTWVFASCTNTWTYSKTDTNIWRLHRVSTLYSRRLLIQDTYVDLAVRLS